MRIFAKTLTGRNITLEAFEVESSFTTGKLLTLSLSYARIPTVDPSSLLANSLKTAVPSDHFPSADPRENLDQQDYRARS